MTQQNTLTQTKQAQNHDLVPYRQIYDTYTLSSNSSTGM